MKYISFIGFETPLEHVLKQLGRNKAALENRDSMSDKVYVLQPLGLKFKFFIVQPPQPLNHDPLWKMIRFSVNGITPCFKGFLNNVGISLLPTARGPDSLGAD